ncbi:transport permease protein [Kordiimonas sediminis]|uniref:Transport permease protein n=1 Tax=Kordiimonas sediminis TaxID=1735581 RepID=A0A919APE4_9PROT|nr:ABC transporter permease [Kordiimonas sediminis]GHF18389.1 transport permease protein [Kordiimonas sediminis]
MRARSTLAIQKDVVFAIFLREMSGRFSGYTFGNIWLVLEPLLMMGVFILLFGARGRGEFGYAEPPIFIFAGFLPFRLLWNSTMRNNMNALGSAKQLIGFRQVKLFDVFLARTLSEGALFFVVGTIIGLIFLWLGFDPVPKDFLGVFGYCFLLWLFAAGFGILACILSEITQEIQKVISLISMPLMILSAVFFPMSTIPEPYRSWLAYNPLVHFNEFIREHWLQAYTSPVADMEYLLAWTIGMLTVALATYRLRWKKVLAT